MSGEPISDNVTSIINQRWFVDLLIILL